MTPQELKNKSKSIGTHARRELYWNGYTKMASKVAGADGAAHCFLSYHVAKDGEGTVDIQDLTKRQRGLVNGGCEFLGLKLKPPEDATSSKWCMVWSEEEAPKAWDDLMTAEPCIYMAADGVYVATRYKRALCKGLSGPLKTLKDVEKVVSELAPEKPLKSISFVGNDPPSINSYNTFVVGPGSASVAPTLPATLGHVASTSTDDIYDYFLKRKSAHIVGEADKLIAQMLADVAKGQTAIISTGKKEAGIAFKNSLMKKAYVHESMKKFINTVSAEGGIEVVVVSGELDQLGEFGKYGGLVFELFYRADLSAFA
jgi:hypothetical protein